MQDDLRPQILGTWTQPAYLACWVGTAATYLLTYAVINAAVFNLQKQVLHKVNMQFYARVDASLIARTVRNFEVIYHEF